MQRWVLTPWSPLRRTDVHREAIVQCKNCCHVYGLSAIRTEMSKHMALFAEESQGVFHRDV